MKRLLIALLSLNLLACGRLPNPNTTQTHPMQSSQDMKHTPPKPTQFADKNATADDIVSCQKQGGVIKKVGMLGFDQCVITYLDAGKLCTKGDDCLSGTCEPDQNSRFNPNKPINGICKADNNFFGCRSFIQDGQVQTICVD
ncbi:hypothetical protein LU293_09070 [Moraxella nasovis]|uniref:hypothetical protein n=1 Tax=Moraxella nasovis TaxID=2904121 RepID=UPI001F60083B|nr:hypothetical protein [Moraxella nasovis]UNU73211.1 hypothetical protein LU293_09070 [Moraxella nasovis]